VTARDDAYRIALEFNVLADSVPAEMSKLVTYWANMGLARVKKNANSANHRPGLPHIGSYTGEGPNRATGNYTRTMNIEYSHGGGGSYDRTAVIGTNAVQARRLEFGFVGVDSLGRHYDVSPLPHWGPMADWLEPRFYEACELLVARIA